MQRRIGKGGMGEVMAARDEQVGRDVAIKRMRAADPSERAIHRFVREAAIQGRLEHPAIVPVHEIGKDSDGLPFFAMKKLTGTTLQKILIDGDTEKFPLQRVLRAFAEVCLAVEFAHVRSVVHRDLKPDNIMLGDFGEVYVLDWGVAKIIGDDDDGEFSDVDSSGGSGELATAAGTTIGTPGYMAPEQVRGLRDIDGRADIYTLGCLLFEILSGEPLHPRGYEGLQSALLRDDNRPSLRAPGRNIPPELDVICAHATRPDREVRIQTARELGDRVQRYLDGDRDLAQRRMLAREHLERARAAFATSDVDEQQHGVAMREAGAALALDPSLAGAAELVGRLMLEPPKTTPREVEQAIYRDDVRGAKVNALAGMTAVLAGLLFMPMLYWMAPSGTPHLTALIGIMIVMGLVSLWNYKTRQPRTGLVVIGNAIIVAVIARSFSPILIAPGMAAVLAMAMVFTPRFSWLGSGITVTGAMSGAVLLPWMLERLGLITKTMVIESGGVLFRAPAIGGEELPILIVGALYVVGLIAGAAVSADIIRTRTRTAHHKLLMQAWQLRQLVPARAG
ncbi:MAG TPA: serine/threonine-protein kinase [Kofleriaceae bacterium]|nr:serine/threonine-protein kinase [Kofleriaceae bacterium]